MKPSQDTSQSHQTCLQWAQEGEKLCKANKISQGIECLKNALKLGTEDLRTLSAIYSQLGNAYFSLREYDKSSEYHSYDMLIARLQKDVVGEAKACGNIGNAFKIQGSFQDALTFTNRQLELSRQLEDRVCEARALYNLASVYHMKGKKTGRMLKAATGDLTLLSLTSTMSQPFLDDLKEAIDYYKKSLELVEEMGDRVSCGRTYGCLGNTHYLLREFDQAVQYHYKRLDVAREFGDKAAQRRAYSNLGNAHVFLSELEKAIEFYRLALSLSIELRDRLAEAQSCFSLANAASLLSDYNTAAQYHGRHLSIARLLKDRAGESRGYNSLAADYRNIGDLPKSAYFLVKQRQMAKEMHDSIMLDQVNDSLRDLLAEGRDDLTSEEGELLLDASADPDQLPCNQRLSLSLRSLNDDFDCGLTRLSAFHSDGDISARSASQMKSGRGMSQEDFFDFLTRVQSKRMDEQRCDAAILGDRTNTKGPRMTDTLMPSPSASELSLDKSSRRLSLFGRMKSSVFKPLSTSTPFTSRVRKSTSAFLRTPHSFARMGSLRSDGARSPGRDSIGSAFSVPADLMTGADAVSAADTTQRSGSDAQFRVPPLPPPRKCREENNRRHSMYVGPALEQQKKEAGNGPDALIDLLMQAQGSGRRMDEQRANLLPGLSQGGQEILDKLQGNGTESEGGNGVDEQLMELLLRAQSQRMNEQRSELGGRRQSQEEETEESKQRPAPTLPEGEDDITALVMQMQAGRLEEQRAALLNEATS